MSLFAFLSPWPLFKIDPKLQEKYKEFHGRLPIIVAETLLRTDPKIELPLWLVQLFKVIFSTENCSRWLGFIDARECLLILKFGLCSISIKHYMIPISKSI